MKTKGENRQNDQHGAWLTVNANKISAIKITAEWELLCKCNQSKCWKHSTLRTVSCQVKVTSLNSLGCFYQPDTKALSWTHKTMMLNERSSVNLPMPTNVQKLICLIIYASVLNICQVRGRGWFQARSTEPCPQKVGKGSTGEGINVSYLERRVKCAPEVHRLKQRLNTPLTPFHRGWLQV